MLHLVYHRADLDGKSSGAALHYLFTKIFPIPHLLVPMDYHDKKDMFLASVMSGDTVVIADFSFDEEIMDYLNSITNLFWYDHHKSAIEKMENSTVRGIRRMDMSGIGIVYMHVLRPELIRLKTPNLETIDTVIAFISDQDNWNKNRYKDIDWERFPQALNRYFQSVDSSCDSPLWEQLFSGSLTQEFLDEALGEGRVIKRWQTATDKGAARNNAFTIYFEGMRAICMNGTRGSDPFKAVYNPNIHDMMLSFTLDKSRKWKVGMYSAKPEIDVSKIAKRYGGGGHAGASGFTCATLDWSGDTLVVG